MIMYPLSELMKRVDCRYTLVIVAAKRARMLTEHKQVSPLDNFDPEDNSPVSYTHLNRIDADNRFRIGADSVHFR